MLLHLTQYTIPEAATVTLTVNYTGELQQESTISLDLLTLLESDEASGRKCEDSVLNSAINYVWAIWQIYFGFYVKIYYVNTCYNTYGF